jgi:hypothetical protein
VEASDSDGTNLNERTLDLGHQLLAHPLSASGPNKGNSLRSFDSPHSFADSLTSDGDGATADFGTDRSPKQPRGDVSARDPV